MYTSGKHPWSFVTPKTAVYKVHVLFQ